jgi:hypothetical protein
VLVVEEHGREEALAALVALVVHALAVPPSVAGEAVAPLTFLVVKRNTYHPSSPRVSVLALVVALAEQLLEQHWVQEEPHGSFLRNDMDRSLPRPARQDF